MYITELMVFIFIDCISLPCFQNCLVAILFSYFLFFVWFDVALSGLGHGTDDLQCIYAARPTGHRLTLVLSPLTVYSCPSPLASFCPTSDATDSVASDERG